MLGQILQAFIFIAWLLSTPTVSIAQERAVNGWRFGDVLIDRWKNARSERNGLGEVIAPYCADSGPGAAELLAAEGLHAPDLGVVSCFEYDHETCNCSSRLGNAATDRNMWTFLDGRFAYFDALMPHPQRGNVGPWIRRNYGFAGSGAIGAVRERYGDRFQNIVRAWDLGDLIVVVHEHPDLADKTVVSIFDPNLLDQIIARLGTIR